MAILKNVCNTGATGGHGMQNVDMLKRRLIEEKFNTESQSSHVLCGNGCEFTIVGEILSLKECYKLSDYIKKNNLCPFCGKNHNGKIDLEFGVKNQWKMIEVSFEMEDRQYNTIYKPQGYRFLLPEEQD